MNRVGYCFFAAPLHLCTPAPLHPCTPAPAGDRAMNLDILTGLKPR
ncbi:MAG: hypothetical protein KME06_16775 [Kastovskya adunca ATA6-11-RM4]|nr:hypothetical protein [Kastovskya adunca ATA6-11-RM4]